MGGEITIHHELTCHDLAAIAIVNQIIRAGAAYGLSPSEIAEDIRAHRALNVSSVSVENLEDTGGYRVCGCVVLKRTLK